MNRSREIQASRRVGVITDLYALTLNRPETILAWPLIPSRKPSDSFGYDVRTDRQIDIPLMLYTI